MTESKLQCPRENGLRSARQELLLHISDFQDMLYGYHPKMYQPTVQTYLFTINQSNKQIKGCMNNERCSNLLRFHGLRSNSRNQRVTLHLLNNQAVIMELIYVYKKRQK